MVSLRRAGMIVELRRGRRPLGVRSGVAVVVVVSAVVVAVGAGTLTKLVERRTVPDSVLVATLCEAIPETIPAMLSKGAAVVAVAVLDATADVPVALARVEDGAGSAVELEVAWVEADTVGSGKAASKDEAWAALTDARATDLTESIDETTLAMYDDSLSMDCVVRVLCAVVGALVVETESELDSPAPTAEVTFARMPSTVETRGTVWAAKQEGQSSARVQ